MVKSRGAETLPTPNYPQVHVLEDVALAMSRMLVSCLRKNLELVYCNRQSDPGVSFVGLCCQH